MNHKHRNEHTWRATDDGMEFLNPDGNVTSRLVRVSATRLEGRLTEFCTGYRPSVVHILEQDPGSPVTVIWSEACKAFLKRHEIYLLHVCLVDEVIEPGTKVTIPARTMAEPGATMPRGRWWTMGAHSYVAGPFRDGDATVGRYSSIALGCSLFGVSHPSDRLTTHPFTYMPHFQNRVRAEGHPSWAGRAYDEKTKPITIGNDVWIGADVTFAGGVPHRGRGYRRVTGCRHQGRGALLGRRRAAGEADQDAVPRRSG